MNCLTSCLETNKLCKDVNVTDVMEFVTVRAQVVIVDDNNSNIITLAEQAKKRTYSGYAAASFAQSKIGHLYTTNHAIGEGPTYYDCTGLVFAAWRSAGHTDIPKGTEILFSLPLSFSHTHIN